MKLLFDEGLSPKLALSLRDLFPESESALFKWAYPFRRSQDSGLFGC